MYQGCGQTEILPIAMMGSRQWCAKECAGRADAVLRAVADLGRGQQSRAARRAGEIVARCEGPMRGFRNSRGDGRTSAAGMKTGDIGRDLGRLRHLSAELETVAVFGIPDASRSRWCVKTEPSVTEKELVERCSVHLGNGKRREPR